MKTTSRIGSKIRALRESKELSINELAKATGLSEELIREIESETEAPSLACYIKIARALGVRAGTFTDDSEVVGPVVCRANRGEMTPNFTTQDRSSLTNMHYYSLACSKTGRHMEPYLIDISQAKDYKETVLSHEGEEFIFVLEGDVEITYGNTKYQLAAGDSIYYDCVLPHDVHTYMCNEARILAVVYAPF